MADTGSLVYVVEADDIYEDRGFHDFSDYRRELWFYDPVNKKVIDKMKDEVRGKFIDEFVGLQKVLKIKILIFGYGR